MSKADTLLANLINGDMSDYEDRTESEELVLIDPTSGKQYKLHVLNGDLTMTEITNTDDYVNDEGINGVSPIIFDPMTGDYYKLHIVGGKLTMSEITRADGVEPHIIIGSDRRIDVPDSLRSIAVQHDHNIETVTFDCPRYWDGHDLSGMKVYITYARPDSEIGRYLCEPVTIDETDPAIMHFDWVISGHVTENVGNLSFLVCTMETDVEGNEIRHWNSELCTSMYISTGLSATQIITKKYPDIINQLILKMEHVERCEVAVTGSEILTLKEQVQSLLQYRLNNTSTILDLQSRVDSLETTLTGAQVAIAHSLTSKGVSVPNNMSIKDVSSLIDSIQMDIPTSLRGISITTPPAQTVYYQGESFNKNGMVVTADFGDGVTVAVDRYTVSPTVVTQNTTQVTVSLTVNGVTKTATYPISVSSMVASAIPIGSIVLIEEGNTSNVQYRLVDKDYLGNALLVREQCLTDTIKYMHTAVSEYAAKYEDSNLDTYLNDTFYGTLPSSTSAVIQAVDIPVRSSASGSASQAYLNRKVFALSATEWGIPGSAFEGETIEYTGNLAANVTYWTREIVGGMDSYAYRIGTDGIRSGEQCTLAAAVRPAFCISKNQLVKETGNGWTLI